MLRHGYADSVAGQDRKARFQVKYTNGWLVVSIAGTVVEAHDALHGFLDGPKRGGGPRAILRSRQPSELQGSLEHSGIANGLFPEPSEAPEAQGPEAVKARVQTDHVP